MRRPFASVLIMLLFFTVAANAGLTIERGMEQFEIDWINMELEVNGIGNITPSEYGNYLDWQYDAALRAEEEVLKNFISSMGSLRIDAFHTARDVLMREPEKNSLVYSYIKRHWKRVVEYTDLSVRLKTELPLFGDDGFAINIVNAGLDPGRYPQYSEYEYSTSFTGLVIDARGLGRIPALAPSIYDEEHRTIYSIDLIHSDSFARWGAVQYTDDPYYRGLENRVGPTPYRIVALENDKLIETDIAISNTDAIIFLQSDASKQSLSQGRLIVILDKEVLQASSHR